MEINFKFLNFMPFIEVHMHIVHKHNIANSSINFIHTKIYTCAEKSRNRTLPVFQKVLLLKGNLYSNF